MKIKEINVRNYINALSGVVECDMPGVLALAVSRNIKALQGEAETYNEAVNKVLKKYAVVDENGKFVPSEDGKFQFEGDNENLCNIELSDIDKQEIEVADLQKVDMSIFEQCTSIKAADIMRLDFMIK